MKNTRLKFRTKMLLWIIGAVIIISGGIQYFISRDISGVVLNAQKEIMRSRVENAVIEIDEQLINDRLLGEALVSNPEFIEAAKTGKKTVTTKLDQYLSNLVKNNSRFELIALIDKAGVAVAANTAKAVGVNVGDREYFKKSMAGEYYVSDPITDRASGNLIFGASLPVKDGAEVVGVLFIGIKVADIYERYIRDIKVGKTGYAFMLAQSGLIIAHPNAKLVMNEDFLKVSENAATNKMFIAAANNEHEVRYWWEMIGGYKVAGARRLSNGWVVILTVPEVELLSSLDRVNVLFIIASLVLIIGISVVVFVLIGSVDKVISVLNKLISELALGCINTTDEENPHLQQALKRNDEFGNITRAVISMRTYLQHISEVAKSMAGKKLNVTVEVRGENDVLGNAIKDMVTNFNAALLQVRLSAKQVSQGAEQVSSASQELSQGATDQAATIERITDSISQLRNQTSVSAENAATASNFAGEANQAATVGQKQMQDLSVAMQSMAGRASEVQQIIKTIDDIAFQTNLLALNAAVEAARAGVHGKGFAVVAEEVRNLAARSAKAAGETASLIESVVAEIERGNSMSTVTAESLNNIADGINKTSELIGGIAESTSSQSQSMEHIAQAIVDIEKVTQANSANSEETASASEEMSSMSVELDRLISSFVLQAAKIKHGTKRSVHKKLTSPSSKVNNHTWGMNDEPVKNAGLVRPGDVIKLDDEDFGKF